MCVVNISVIIISIITDYDVYVCMRMCVCSTVHPIPHSSAFLLTLRSALV